jgi:hypothetical protein
LIVAAAHAPWIGGQLLLLVAVSVIGVRDAALEGQRREFVFVFLRLAALSSRREGIGYPATRCGVPPWDMQRGTHTT